MCTTFYGVLQLLRLYQYTLIQIRRLVYQIRNITKYITHIAVKAVNLLSLGPSPGWVTSDSFRAPRPPCIVYMNHCRDHPVDAPTRPNKKRSRPQPRQQCQNRNEISGNLMFGSWNLGGVNRSVFRTEALGSSYLKHEAVVNGLQELISKGALIHVLAVQETWLQHDDQLRDIPGYYWKGRNRTVPHAPNTPARGGGVGFLIHSSIPAESVKELPLPDDAGSTGAYWISINVGTKHNAQHIYLGTVYGESNSFLKSYGLQLEDIWLARTIFMQEILSRSQYVYCFGDFNAHLGKLTNNRACARSFPKNNPQTNNRGQHLFESMERCDLAIVNGRIGATPPAHTRFPTPSSDANTTKKNKQPKPSMIDLLLAPVSQLES